MRGDWGAWSRYLSTWSFLSPLIWDTSFNYPFLVGLSSFSIFLCSSSTDYEPLNWILMLNKGRWSSTKSLYAWGTIKRECFLWLNLWISAHLIYGFYKRGALLNLTVLRNHLYSRWKCREDFLYSRLEKARLFKWIFGPLGWSEEFTIHGAARYLSSSFVNTINREFDMFKQILRHCGLWL